MNRSAQRAASKVTLFTNVIRMLKWVGHVEGTERESIDCGKESSVCEYGKESSVCEYGEESSGYE